MYKAGAKHHQHLYILLSSEACPLQKTSQVLQTHRIDASLSIGNHKWPWYVK